MLNVLGQINLQYNTRHIFNFWSLVNKKMINWLYISSGRWRTTCRTWATSSKCWSPTIRRSSRKSSSSSMSNTKKVKSSSYKLQVSFLLTSYKSPFYFPVTRLLFTYKLQVSFLLTNTNKRKIECNIQFEQYEEGEM